MKVYETTSPEETEELGKRFAGRLCGTETVAMFGEPGAGKTVFSKGLAKGLGISELVTSPTFTICNEYASGRVPLYHYDMYRISDESDLEEVGFSERLGKGVTLIEWAENIPGSLPKDAIRLYFRYTPQGREIAIDEDFEF